MKPSSKKNLMVAALIVASLILSACGKATPTKDPALQITEIASTFIAQMTQNAVLTPSATPTPTETPTPTMEPPTPTIAVVTDAIATPKPQTNQDFADDKAVWAGDVGLQDGTIVKPGSSFTKTWAIKNTGKTTWVTAYRLAYLDGLVDSKTMYYVHLPKSVKPEETVNVSVTFTAPSEFGTYYSYWRLVNDEGFIFGEQMSLKIYVGNP